MSHSNVEVMKRSLADEIKLNRFEIELMQLMAKYWPDRRDDVADATGDVVNYIHRRLS